MKRIFKVSFCQIPSFREKNLKTWDLRTEVSKICMLRTLYAELWGGFGRRSDMKKYRTSEVAEMMGIHPNTVRY